ncbi:MAG: metal-dependent transcriptional regulator [Candidatus Dormibacteraeota bacterium]|uniref:Metal-dependent transcriptional regulator n=1 Tax=Candidatus Amunia macphersoniae TaxID=3127014 RepID=A0A934KH12_9BACT|nr:metal-dependent transcriptional regulator [Candidatus Dormibacteraeota bacterium]
MSSTDAPLARSEVTDRYLETIYYIEHEGDVPRPGRIAEWLGVSPPTVSVSLQRLARDGWVTLANDRSVHLSDAGRVAAATVVRRHRLIERWLTDVLGLDWATADREAASLSHGVSEVVLERLDEHLGRPSTCPHGNVIPGRRPPQGRPMLRLVELPSGVESRVFRVSEVAEHDAPQLLAVLHDGGLTPQARVLVRERGEGQLRLVVDGHPVVISEGVAAAVWVESPPE